MTRKKLYAWMMLIVGLAGVTGLGAWNYVQTRRAAAGDQSEWIQHVSEMVEARQLSMSTWVERIRAARPSDLPLLADLNPSIVGLFLTDPKTRDVESWIDPVYKTVLRTMDPRLVVLQLKAGKTISLGPVLMINGSPCTTVVKALDDSRVLTVVIQNPGLLETFEREAQLRAWHAFVYDFEGHPIFLSGDLPSVTGALPEVLAQARAGKPSGFIRLQKKYSWQWLATYRYVPELDWIFIVAQPVQWVYAPFFFFLISFAGLLTLVGLPVRAAQSLRRAREAMDLGQFASRVDNFVHGRDVILNEPPYPFKELMPIVLSLRWLMPQWKKAEAFPRELALERKLLSILIESLPEGILFFNAQGALQLGNELGRVFLALQQESGREFKMVTGVQVPRGFLEPYAEPVFTGQQKNVGKEVEVPWADGKHLYRVWVEAVEETEGQISGFIVVVRDITFRKQWEYVQEQVLGGITHDLRGPLSAIMGYLDLLKRQLKDGPPKAVEYVQLAREAGVRLTQMVSDILDVVRFEQGKIDIVIEAISVDEMFHRLENIFGVTATQKGVTLKLNLDRPGDVVSGDPKLLERVLDNLVSNAIKFTPNGGSVTVSGSRNASRMVFEVWDTGRGIPKEAQSRIFDKFQQVRPGDRSAGYGLGLAVAKFIVEAHKGEIRVESEVGKGSHFTFWIPDRQVTPKKMDEGERTSGAGLG